MKRNQRMIWLSAGLALTMALGGCGQSVSGNRTVENDTTQDSTSDSTAEKIANADGAAPSSEIDSGTQTDTHILSDMFTDRDYESEYDKASAVSILLDGNSVKCDADAVAIDGSVVTIKDEGTYVLSGTLKDGMIIVDAENTDKIHLICDNASISSSNSAALYVRQADKVFVTLAADTKNILANCGSFLAVDENNIDAAVFSKDDLTFNGSGSLTVTSSEGHGIVSKDDLVFTGGSYTISSARQALNGKESVRIADGTFMITSGKNGIHSEDEDDDSLGFVYLAGGSCKITAEGKGICASNFLQIDGGNFDICSADDSIHSNGSVTVNAGTFEISSGDDGFHADETLTIAGGSISITESYEGLEGLDVEIQGGDLSIVASDDGINAAGGMDSSGMGGRDAQFGGGKGFPFSGESGGSILISGGITEIHASGDALDSNGTISMTGGFVATSGPNMGDTSILDYDVSGVISGGTFIGMGAVSMAQNFDSDSTQGVLLSAVGNQSAGTEVALKDAEGNVLLRRQADQDFSCVILSCPEVSEGNQYTLVVGSSEMSVTMKGMVYSNTEGIGNMGDMGSGGADWRVPGQKEDKMRDGRRP